MNILYLSRWLPYPPDNGSKIRIYNTLKYLAEYGHKIHLITFYQPDENPQKAEVALRSICQDINFVLYKPFQPDNLKSLMAFMALKPRSVITTFQKQMANLIDAAFSYRQIDTIIASQIDMAVYGIVAKKHRIPAILEELELGIYHDQFNFAKNIKLRVRHGLTWFKVVAYVRKLATTYQNITVVSEKERELVQSLVKQTKISLLSNGVDLEHYVFKPYHAEERADQIVFNGALTFSLNYEAIQYYVNEIYPLLKSNQLNLKLIITGHNKGVNLQGLTKVESKLPDDIYFSGFVDDIRPIINSSKVCIAPLLRGGGTRLKIIEAFALGTPVVATSKGAEGLNVRDGIHLLIADTPEQFASSILRLQADPILASTLAINARELVEKNLDWQGIISKLDALLKSQQY